VEILALVDRLENLITSSQRMPMTNRVLVREQEVLQMIDQMRAAVPEEIKQARRVHQERERLLAQAQAEASRIIAAAREEADRLINDEKMVLVATERATEIEHEAEERARQLRDGADAYAAETLQGLEEELTNLQTRLEQTILSVQMGLQTLNVRAREGEKEELEETVLQGEEEEAETEAAWPEEGATRMAPGRAMRDEFPPSAPAISQRTTAPLRQSSEERSHIGERKPFPPRRH
jgi:hypothetical protein